MKLDYFYEAEGEHYRFYQIPAMLLEEKEYRGLSDTAKILYGILLSRIAMSRKNGWVEKETGRLYIIYNLKRLSECMRHSDRTITKAMNQLMEADLIRKKKRGQGKSDIIYVMDFSSAVKGQEESCTDLGTGNESGTDISGGGTYTDGDAVSEEGIHTGGDVASLEGIRTGSEIALRKGIPANSGITSQKKSPPGDGSGGDAAVRQAGHGIYQELLKEQIEYTNLLHDKPDEKDIIDNILEVMVHAFTTKKNTLRVCGENMPANMVRNRLKNINMEHIKYILISMKNSRTKIASPPLFLLTALYNAPATIDTYYKAWVNHDMHNGLQQDAGIKEGYPASIHIDDS